MGRISAAAPGDLASCIDTEQPIGIARNGIPILPALTDQGRDAVARDVQDASAGGPTGRDAMPTEQASDAWTLAHTVGILRGSDGHVTGSRSTARAARTAEPCVAAISTPAWTHPRDPLPWARRSQIHYHLTSDFPYVVGCFRGRPTAWTEPATEAPPVAPAPPALTTLDVTTTPAAMYPGFDRGVSDYVVRCEPNSAVVVHVAAPAGITVSVDGAPAASGTFATSLRVSEGQSFAFTVTAAGTTTSHHARCLPSDFVGWSSKLSGQPQADGT